MRPAAFIEKYPGAAGIVPMFLCPDDPRPAKTQINEGYAHGGGWRKFDGFTALIDWNDPRGSQLDYPGDPPMLAKAYCCFGEELVILFVHDWCAIVQPDLSYEIARLD